VTIATERRHASFSWVPLRGQRGRSGDDPATAVGVLSSVGMASGEPIGPESVWFGLTDRAPHLDVEDYPESIAGGYLTPDDADSLAQTLIRYAAATRGSKPVQYLTRRDSVVIDGEAHDVARLVVDADTGVAVYTRQGGRRTPAARYYVGELVKLADGE